MLSLTLSCPPPPGASRVRVSRAFTLAEVLITIGIIGIVAALTLPGLISKHNKKIAETRLEKFYSTFNQAIKLSEVENGDASTWDLPTNTSDSIEEWFEKYFKKTFKYTKTEKIILSGKWESLIVNCIDGSEFIITSSGTEPINDIQFVPNASKLKNFDYSKYDDQVIHGKDAFTFFFDRKLGLLAYGYQLQERIKPEQSLEDAFKYGIRDSWYEEYGCYKGKKIFCSALIMYNGWKIPDDYSIKF